MSICGTKLYSSNLNRLLWKWVGRGWIFQCVGEVLDGKGGYVHRGGYGHDALVREELHGFGDAIGTSLQDIHLITAVVFGGSANIPALNSIRGPGETYGRGLKDE